MTNRRKEGTCNFAWNGMGFSDLVTPVSTTHRDDGQLGEDDGPSNGGRHLEESESKIKDERWQKKLTLLPFPV